MAIELCRGFERRAAADNDGAAEILLAVRGDLAPIGGSHAQRDLFDLVLADTVVATGDHRLAANLALGQNETLAELGADLAALRQGGGRTG